MIKICCSIGLLIILCSAQICFGQAAEKKKLTPTVTIPAPKGSKGFGMPSTGSAKKKSPVIRWVGPSVTELRKIVTTTFDEMSMSDPFIFPDKKTQTYYLTSSGGSIYKSKDLKTWTGPYGAIDVRGTWMEGLFHDNFTKRSAAELVAFANEYSQ
ncbi:MAG: hypothetical protein PVG39_28460 [Desulfobacteraceae bacterium]|jgi:hypothetical protein